MTRRHRHIHEIAIDADSTRFSMTIEGVPSEGHPDTGKLTRLSVQATLAGSVTLRRIGI